ncbi:MAG: UDPGP type 1 family protein [Planctomycetota bacterium]
MQFDLNGTSLPRKDDLTAIGQGHVFQYWNDLSEGQRRDLLADLNSINLGELSKLATIAASPVPAHVASRIEPAKVIRAADVPAHARAQGCELLSKGRVAAFTVAGGQGTRLGFDGPKGAFQISPVMNKSLFQLFAESILATDRRYGCAMRWYIMTSSGNDSATREYFVSNRYFGLAQERVRFFQQGVMPAFDRAGKILLDDKHRIALSPDGHGGSLLALARTGMLAEMAAHGIRHISYFQVDNPLVYCLDPVFIGLHDTHQSEMSSKTLSKADDLERVGNFVMADGRLAIIEYSDLPEALAHAKNTDGSRRFDAANIAVHLLSRGFIERLTRDAAAFALPWHRAEKKIPYIDLDTGRRIEPAQANGVKLESFVFDALPLADRAILLETSRAEEFSPIKNASGIDSVETARRDMSRRAARWMEVAGFQIPCDTSGAPEGFFEISPLFSLDSDELKSKSLSQRSIRPGESVYLSA